jgi:MORN repeat
MGNCTDCKSFINKTELVLGLESDLLTNTNSISVKNTPDKNYSSFTRIMPKLIGLYKGYSTRKMFLHIYKRSRPEYNYFEISEVLETVSKVLNKANFKEKRAEINLKNSKYTGEWCGGFRQGYGIMEWEDGSKYEGHWMYSRPSGSGKFIYKTGEGYEGNWKSYFIFNKSLFKTGKISQWKDCVQDGYRKL